MAIRVTYLKNEEIQDRMNFLCNPIAISSPQIELLEYRIINEKYNYGSKYPSLSYIPHDATVAYL
jgi:hypothetical protein